MSLNGRSIARSLLLWGMLAGLCGGLAAAGFATIAAEPAIERAIGFEESRAHPHAGGGAHGHADEAAPVSREVQRGVGLPLATGLYGVALGGLLGLGFAAAYGRVGAAGPARTAGWIVAIGFVAAFLVPFLKYPANPPAVGAAETVGMRTQLFALMIAISLVAAVAALRLRRTVAARRTGPVAAGAALATYASLMVFAVLVLPPVDETPAGFPAATLWEFRAAAAGTQVVLWMAMGIVFTLAVRHVMRGARSRPAAH